jgi:murein DD-endopeptidase MepM/ murein hydrolase activator NlpD
MLSRSFITSLLIASLLIATLPAPQEFVLAQTADELKGNLDTLSAKIKALDDEIKAYSTKISQTQGEAKTLKGALNNLEVRRTGLSKDIAYTKLRINQAEQNISFTQGKIQNTETTLQKTKDALAESLRSLMHNDQSVPRFVSALAPGAHISDALDIIKRGGDVSDAINEKARALVDTKTTLAIQKASYEEHKDVLLTLNSTLTGQKQLVDQTAKDKNYLLTETKNKESGYQKLVAERKKKKSDLEAEQLDIEAKLQTIVDSSKIPKYGKGILQYPVENIIITQYFGNTPFASKNPQVYNGSGHNGIDLGARVGTPILAAAAGTVLGTGDTDTACNGVSYGKWVLIKHANGLTSLYAHLSVIQVKAGDTVTVRQKIALSGNTGYTTGPHLHFTVYASDAVQITNYVSKVCGTNMRMPIAPRAAYLNPLSYL